MNRSTRYNKKLQEIREDVENYLKGFSPVSYRKHNKFIKDFLKLKNNFRTAPK